MSLPEDPIGMLGEGAIGHHEMYTAWQNAGFTEEQSLELLKTVIATMIQVVAGEC